MIGSLKRVAIRADGGTDIGMGHIMRSLSLAKQFKKAGYKVYFLTKHKNGIEKIKSEGFKFIQLKSDNSLDTETQELIDILSKGSINLLIIDSYNVNRKYFLSLKQNVDRLAYIDDLNKFVYPVDILINGNITAEYMNYTKYADNELMLLGARYNLIREEFKNIHERHINRDVSEIMVTTGGGDPYNLSCKITEIMLSCRVFDKVRINIVIGNAFTNRHYLRYLKERYKNIFLYENVKHMSSIMLRSDIAISAGGSTLYELCACGTPTLAFIMADNQEFIVNKMDELGYVKSLGWHRKINSSKVINKTIELIYDYNLRKFMSKKGQALVDGNGAKRIVEAIESI